MSPDQTTLPQQTGSNLEEHVAKLGHDLGASLSAVLAAVPRGPHGPQTLAGELGLDKVLTSRLLKAVRNARDPIAVVYHVPGPEPLRRFLRAARRRAVPTELVSPAEEAVNRFEHLIRREVGDRSALDAMVSTWLPEARAEFELRRKQSAFKAMSQLKGSAADVNLAAVFLHPSSDGEHLDIVWVMGLLGLRRLRPGARVRATTRRLGPDGRPRTPTGLGQSDAASNGLGFEGLRLDEFCVAPPAQVDVHKAGEVVHYVLGGDDYGPNSAVDLLLAEANLAEIDRYVDPAAGRKGYMFAEVNTPSASLMFDVFVHADVYPESHPSLRIYDTAFDGVANPNDPARDIDLMDLSESLRLLGTDTSSFRAEKIPNYASVVRHVFDRMGWDGNRFRAYRCSVEYPIYGTQITAVFDPPPPPAKA